MPNIKTPDIKEQQWSIRNPDFYFSRSMSPNVFFVQHDFALFLIWHILLELLQSKAVPRQMHRVCKASSHYLHNNISFCDKVISSIHHWSFFCENFWYPFHTGWVNHKSPTHLKCGNGQLPFISMGKRTLDHWACRKAC